MTLFFPLSGCERERHKKKIQQVYYIALKTKNIGWLPLGRRLKLGGVVLESASTMFFFGLLLGFCNVKVLLCNKIILFLQVKAS